MKKGIATFLPAEDYVQIHEIYKIWERNGYKKTRKQNFDIRAF